MGKIADNRRRPHLLKRWCKGLSLAAGAVCLFFGLVPLVLYGFFHEGIALLILLGIAFAALPLLWDRLPKRRWWRVVRMAAALGLSLFLVLELAFSAVMIGAAYHRPPPREEPVTVVVLGCLVVGDQPSRMLLYRLEAALAFLETAPPATPVVVSGGQGEVEDVSEASVMAAWLIQRGIDPRRIFLEDRSVNTEENLAFSAGVIVENGLPVRVAVVSDGFHQLRGGLQARRAGLVPFAVPGRTPWGLLPGYWLREQLAVLAAVLL